MSQPYIRDDLVDRLRDEAAMLGDAAKTRHLREVMWEAATRIEQYVQRDAKAQELRD